MLAANVGPLAARKSLLMDLSPLNLSNSRGAGHVYSIPCGTLYVELIRCGWSGEEDGAAELDCRASSRWGGKFFHVAFGT